jgi:hypothetical protein
MEQPVQRVAEGAGINLHEDGLRNLPKRLEGEAPPQDDGARSDRTEQHEVAPL